jgi:hypothetical protein
MLLHQPIELAARQVLQDAVKDRILVRHGVVLFAVPDRLATSRNEKNQRRALCHAKTLPDSRGTSPGMTIRDSEPRA